ncbi:LacI family DNA-binding transcriptional regulator [Bacillus sp. 1P06AnD]|uniref:LacI family DNA-binding transcriptional regulator n=1 Tax=Bacillus sp. 1P06AnD TaxID=3132208 RepID=UPI0039A10C68
MTITIKDVAKLANVAPSTVSRVIADHAKISQSTKERVREAMKELGYHPNFIARSLANQSTQVIGLVLPASTDIYFQNPFFSTVLRGLGEAAHEKCYSIQMNTGKTDEENLQAVVEMVQGRRVDGIILLYSKIDDPIICYLKERNFPFVIIGKPYDGGEEITHVDNNNFRAAKEATEYLLGKGHQRIGFIGGDPQYVVTLDRKLGYRKALEEAGVDYSTDMEVESEFLEMGGKQAVAALLQLVEPPTALIVTDDLVAMGVLNVLKERHISVPEEMSIVSFNNVLFAELANPPLTSVDIGIYDLGYQAAKSLIQHIENPKEPKKRIILPFRLVERESCMVCSAEPTMI